jgi:hypothetical protein
MNFPTKSVSRSTIFLTKPGQYSSAPFGFNPATGGMDIILRDFVYERLCAVAKTADHADVRVDPLAAYRWEFAAAVSKLNGHPINWLLQWAGVKVTQALVGSVDPRHCCTSIHIHCIWSDDLRGGGAHIATPLDNSRVWHRGHVGGAVFCFTPDGSMAVETNN